MGKHGWECEFGIWEVLMLRSMNDSTKKKIRLDVSDEFGDMESANRRARRKDEGKS